MSRADMKDPGENPDALPSWASVLAVVAHPDDESFGLGAILDAFARAGTKTEVLCLTSGEASTLHGVPGDLAAVRAAELDAAAGALGVTRTTLLQYPDGALAGVERTTLAANVAAAAESAQADGLLVFDSTGVTGHPDHVAATAAGLLAAETLNLPVLGWTLPEAVAAQLNQEFSAGFTGHPDVEIGLRLPVDRERQHVAIQAHTSQAVPGSVLWRRLELLGNTESLRWLRRRADVALPSTPARPAEALVPAEGRPMRVEHQGADRFDISIRGHVISVDQPVQDGGDDTAPTPTELFIASLASCVAFYARRYLARHGLPTQGLAVEATFEMGTRPARVSGIDVRLILPVGVPDERRDALLAVASHCTVHNTLLTTPRVTIALADPT
jgi:LmbE family N-acetylglucosaminyl deacetylase/uncharacterized OsmC-like protein